MDSLPKPQKMCIRVWRKKRSFTTLQLPRGVPPGCARARVSTRVYVVQDIASAAAATARWRNTSPSGVELGFGDSHWDQPVRGDHYGPGGDIRVGLRSESGRIADRCTCGDAIPLTSVYPVH